MYNSVNRPNNLAIRHLQARMGDSAQRTSDESIAAVAMLVSIEHENRNFIARDFHRQALSTQLSIRGGLDALMVSNQIVASLVFWTSMTIADDPLHPEHTFNQSHVPDWQVLTISDPVRFDFRSLDESQGLQDLMSAVDNLSLRFNQLRASEASSAGYISTIVSVEGILQALLIYSPKPSNNPTHFYLANCCSYAAVLHIFNPVGGYYPESRLFTNAVMHKLKTTFSYALKLGDPPGLLMLWLLSNGAIAAKGLPEWQWFLAQLVKLVERLHIQSWFHMRQGLSQVIWHAVFCEKTFESLWISIEEKMYYY